LLGFLCFGKEKGACRYVDSDKTFDTAKAEKDSKDLVRRFFGVLFCLKHLLQR
jgi:hypothetical protein